MNCWTCWPTNWVKYTAGRKSALVFITSLLSRTLIIPRNITSYYPVPFLTPWGRTLRHRPLDNGVYWIETERCVEVLALCYPVWDGELSEGMSELGRTLEIEGEMGYLYFIKDASCVALWELLRTRSELIDAGLIRKPELMNAIWRHQPGYALGYNAQEQAGLHDTLGLLVYALGVEDRDLEGSPEYMIAMDPDAGTDYIGFWR